jgi:hypothetical protein
MRLVQLSQGDRRATGLAENGHVRLLASASVYELALLAIETNRPLADVALSRQTEESIDPEQDGWQWLPCIDHPEPARCLVSGTGLTHASSAKNRQAMHTATENLTDSMKMYLSGVQHGKPASGEAGVAPEWFYKGRGEVLRGHLQPLTSPAHAEDGGEEGEIAGIYIIDGQGRPRRIGMAQGNEFSDHIRERRNYLYLAESKLRECAIGPELWLDADFRDVRGRAAIERDGTTIWSQELRTGEAAMCHSLANVEHHHFKHASHRRPGDVHVHFFGASAFSFGENIRLEDGDIMTVSFEGFGQPLRNPIRIEHQSTPAFIAIEPL